MQWLAGDERRREQLLEAVARLEREEGVTWLRVRERRRRLARVELGHGESVFAKHYLTPVRHRMREWWKRHLHLTTAEREWRTLTRLYEAGIRVPQPLAQVRLASGERVLLTAWIEGVSLGEALPLARGRRHRVLGESGTLVRRLHEAGWVHRDLHRENVLVGDDGPWLIDLQAASRFGGRRARRRDLGRLDFSLRRTISLPDRLRLRASALGAERPFDAGTRAALRAIGDASRKRGRTHAASRARRSLRPGRLYRRLETPGMRGLVARDADEAALRKALSEAGGSPGIEIRRYADRVGARRAWHVAHALAASDLACVRPIAFLEGAGRRGSLLALADEPAEAVAPGAELLRTLNERLVEAGFTDGLAPEDVAVHEGRAVISALERVRFVNAAPTRARPSRGR